MDGPVLASWRDAPARSAILDFVNEVVAAVAPFVGTGGTSAAFVTDPGEEISPTTRDWVETYVPDQVGTHYTAHLTVGLATVDDLRALRAEPFSGFDVRPVGVALYQLGNNGTARARLRSWPLNASGPTADR
jgi:hypothetical protein